MDICERGYRLAYALDVHGRVTMCAWNSTIIGNLLEDDMENIFKSDRAKEFWTSLANKQYNKLGCDTGYCPYMNNNRMKDHMVEYKGCPSKPEGLSLSFEHFCNYRCTYCASSHMMDDVAKNHYKEEMDIIEERIRKIMPYVKFISANGNGELFCSPRTLRLLSQWKPLAPREECSVWLETNGSLFDEKHWKQIENLGQYNLTVSITVNSFEEDIYQHLSGTKLPISVIESNLKYISKLRKEGIVNRFQINNIVQEMNYRQVPSFVKKCLEEYEVDLVNLRGIFIDGNAGGVSSYINWFMDVRNPQHPYYNNYKKVMSDPILKNPKVVMVQGDYDSEGDLPGIKKSIILDTITYMMNNSFELTEKLKSIIGLKNTCGIYGAGVLGKTMVKILHGDINISAMFDGRVCESIFEGIKITRFDINECKDIPVIIVTVYRDFDEICCMLRKAGYKGEIINAFNLVE